MTAQKAVPAVGDQNRFRGYLIALTGAVLGGVYYIPYKILINRVPPEVFVLGIFYIGVAVNILVMPFASGEYKVNRITVIAALAMAVFSITGNYAIGKSLLTLSSSVSSVIVRIEVLIVMSAGFFLFKEHMSVFLFIGAIVSIAGIGIISSGSGNGFIIGESAAGVLWAMSAALSFGTIHIITKAVTKNIKPSGYNLTRMAFAALILSLSSETVSGLRHLSLSDWMLLVIAGIFGPYLSRLMQITCLKYIPVSHATIFNNLLPVFTLVFAWLLISDIPTARQLTGSLVVLLGLFTPVFYRVVKNRRK